MSVFWVVPKGNQMPGGSKKAKQIGTIGCSSAGSEMGTLLSFRPRNYRISRLIDSKLVGVWLVWWGSAILVRNDIFHRPSGTNFYSNPC